MLVAGLVSVPAVRSEEGPGNPARAVQRWLDAARDGDTGDLRRAVAPSQRPLLDEADPTGLGGDVDLLDAVDLDDSWAQDLLSPDEALVPTGTVTDLVCPQARDRCATGSGPGGGALAVREHGRWYAVARPFRVLLPPSREGALPTAVVTSRLVVTGGLTADVSVEREVSGQTCASLGADAFDVDSDPFEDVRVSLTAGTGPLTGTAPRRRAEDGLSLRSEIFEEWQPRGEVVLRRAPDGSAGELRIERWQFDDPFEEGSRPDVDGLLTWTCRDQA